MHHRKILLGSGQQQIRGVAHRIAVFQVVEFRDHRGAHRDPVGQRAARGGRAFLSGAQPDEEGEEDQHEFAVHQP